MTLGYKDLSFQWATYEPRSGLTCRCSTRQWKISVLDIFTTGKRNHVVRTLCFHGSPTYYYTRLPPETHPRGPSGSEACLKEGPMVAVCVGSVTMLCCYDGW